MIFNFFKKIFGLKVKTKKTNVEDLDWFVELIRGWMANDVKNISINFAEYILIQQPIKLRSRETIQHCLDNLDLDRTLDMEGYREDLNKASDEISVNFNISNVKERIKLALSNFNDKDDHEIGIDSKVFVNNSLFSNYFIPMIDFNSGVSYHQASEAIMRPVNSNYIPPSDWLILKSGNSWHAYGLSLVSSELKNNYFSYLNTMDGVDRKWLAMSRKSGFMRLRLTNNSGKKSKIEAINFVERKSTQGLDNHDVLF